jgi:hypothetical protein
MSNICKFLEEPVMVRSFGRAKMLPARAVVWCDPEKSKVRIYPDFNTGEPVPMTYVTAYFAFDGRKDSASVAIPVSVWKAAPAAKLVQRSADRTLADLL